MGDYRYSREKLLEEIRRLSSPEDPVSKAQMDEEGVCASSTIKHRFGSWNKALRQAGVGINKHYSYSTRDILQSIRELASPRGIAPSHSEYKKKSEFGMGTVTANCGKWWKAVVRAGLYPRRRRPLTPDQYLRFHKAALNREDSVDSFIGVILMFTGLPPRYLSDMSSDWFDYLYSDRYDSVIEVPREYTNSDSIWTFKLPQTFTVDGCKKTHLPELARWYFSDYAFDQQLPSKSGVHKRFHSIAEDAALKRRLTPSCHREEGKYADVTTNDLRSSLGVRMARRGAPRKAIRRHLGIEYTNWHVSVDDFFLWNYIYHDYIHTDYEPPSVYIEPDWKKTENRT